MTGTGGDYDETIKQRSGWLIPLAVFVVTAALSGLLLVYYLAPAPTSFIEEHPAPTAHTNVVRLSVGRLALAIPANYLRYARDRDGGQRNTIDFFALFPAFAGYSDARSQAFADGSANSPVVYLLIRTDRFDIGEAERLQRIYLGYVADAMGSAGPYGLTHYVFRDDSGYRHEDLFVGAIGDQPVVMRCARFSQRDPSPSCFRDVRIAGGVMLSYRFKRARLSEWHDIAMGVAGLVHGFKAG